MREYQIRLRTIDSKKIYLDPQEEDGFYLYPGEIRKHGLKDGMILSEELVRQLHEEYAVPRAKKRALGLLAKKDLTESELLTKLQASHHDERSIAAAMAFVTEHGYIDDEAYARDYIYFHKGRKSHRQMREALLHKGVSGTITDMVLEEEGEQPLEEIRPLVEKYAGRFPELDYQAEQKICMHFGRKGYRISRIKEIVEEIREQSLDFYKKKD